MNTKINNNENVLEIVDYLQKTFVSLVADCYNIDNDGDLAVTLQYGVILTSGLRGTLDRAVTLTPNAHYYVRINQMNDDPRMEIIFLGLN